MSGAISTGSSRYGKSWMATIRADARVLPVSSNTRNAKAKLPAIAPIVPMADARITRRKFLVQSFAVFMSITSANSVAER